jgi:hypothetical protein
LEKSEGFVRKGAEPRVVPVNSSTVFIRESNIADAARVYTSLKIDNLDHLEVSYVSPAVYGQCVSPNAGAISSHEGQVSDQYCHNPFYSKAHQSQPLFLKSMYKPLMHSS